MLGIRLSRRSLLGSVGAASIAPALPVGAHESMSALGVPQTVPAFIGRFTTGPQQRSGQSPAQYSAAILGGEVSGPLLQGIVQAGRIEWLVDAASQSVQITAHYAVLRADGVLVQVRDRSVHPEAIKPVHSAALRTAPEIVAVDGAQDEASPLLVGLLDASGFSAGQVVLRAFQVV